MTESIRYTKWKIVACVVFALAAWGFSRGFLFKKLFPILDPADIASFGEGFLVTRGVFPLVISIIGIIVLSCYVLFFVYLEKRLYGTGFQKGLIYGGTFFLVYLAAFIEFYRMFNGAMSQVSLAVLADGGPLLLAGIVCGLLLGTDTNVTRLRPKPYLWSLLFVAAAITLGRILFYTTIHRKPNITGALTILIVFLFGLSVGISYYFLTQGIHAKKRTMVPIVYSLVFLPISLSGNTLICVKNGYPLLPMIALTFMDIIAIILGGLITEYLVRGNAS